MGFYGIGGVGKTALLRQFEADARQSGVTDYVVSLDLKEQQITTPAELLGAIIAALDATGCARQRVLWFLSRDTLQPCKTLHRRLQQQEEALRPISIKVTAEDHSRIGDVRISLQAAREQAIVTTRELIDAFCDTVRDKLPGFARSPHRTSHHMVRRRLLVLLADNIDATSADVRQAIREIFVHRLAEHTLLVCTGRLIDDEAPDHQRLLRQPLTELDDETVQRWLHDQRLSKPDLVAALVALTRGVPLLIRLALAQIDQIRRNGREPTASDFQMEHEHTFEIATAFLTRSYLNELRRSPQPHDRHLYRLIRFGCLLRRLKPAEIVHIAGIPREEAAPLIQTLEQRGFLFRRRIHDAIRHSAQMMLRHDEPAEWQRLIGDAIAYYEAHGGDEYLGDILYLRALRGDAIGDDLLAGVAQRLQRRQSAADLVDAVQEAPVTPAVRLALANARIDLALSEGRADLAIERMREALATLPLAPAPPQVCERLQRLAHLLQDDLPLDLRLALVRSAPEPTDATRREEVQILLALGKAARASYRYHAAATWYQEALGLARQIDDRHAETDALWELGEVACLQANLLAAADYYQQALELARQIGARRAETNALWGLGEVACLQANLPAAADHYQQALTLARQIGARRAETNALWGLGEVACLQANLPAAADYYQQALTLARQSGDRLNETEALLGLGEVACLQANLPAAADYYQQALGLARRIDARHAETEALLGLGTVACGQVHLPAAADYYQQALGLARRIDARHAETDALLGLGAVARMQVNLPAAANYYQQALELTRQIGARLNETSALLGLGEVALAAGNLPDAENYYQQALGLACQIGACHAETTAFEGLGEVARQQDNLPAAADYLQQALTLARQIGARLTETQALRDLGEVALAAGDLPVARRRADESLQVAQQIEDLNRQALAHDLLRRIAERAGQPEQARWHWAEYLRIMAKLRARR
ncbi:MAG: tetratricopeptide repeat protein [Oscillochloridaceae bacterium]|nr:tetratricopeptide repeat protein [Oscillochloridaceae bacterium]